MRDRVLYGEFTRRVTVTNVNDSMIVEQLRALADPVRLSIVRELRGGTRCACELAEVADVSPPLLSHHLKVLRTAGLISGARRGRWIDYTLDDGALHALLGWIETPAPRRSAPMVCAS
jgi:ArsR family transcriptional regulator